MAGYNLGDAELTTSVNLDGLKGGLQDAERTAEAGGEQAGSRLGSGMARGIAAATGAALAAVGVLIGQGIAMNAAAEQTQAAFTTLLGSAEKAQSFLDDLRDFAASTPFEFPELADSAKKLLAMGFAAEDIIPMMTSIGDAVGALGGGSAEIDRVTMALGQMRAKGKVSAEEMMQLAELGIPAWQMLADSMGLSTAEVMKLAEQGKITADTAIPALINGMNQAFGGAMQTQAMTFNGLLSTLKDTASMALMAFTGPLFQLAKGGLIELGNLVSSPTFQQFASTLGQQVATAISTVATLLMTVIPPAIALITGLFAQGSASTGQFGSAFTTFQGVVATVMQAVQLVVSAVLTQMQLFWQANGASIMAFVATTWTQIGTIIQTALALIQGIVIGVLAIVLDFIQQHGAQIQQVLTAAWTIISSVITATLALIQGTLSAALAIFQGDWAGAWQAIQAMSATVLEAIQRIITSVLEIIAAFFGTSLSGIASTWSSNFEKMRSAASTIFETIKATITTIVGDIRTAAETQIGSILNFVEGLAGRAAAAGRAFIDSLRDGVMGAIDRLIADAKAALQGLSDLLPGSEPKDPSSPLRGLADRGRAIITNMLPGMQAGFLDVDNLMRQSLGAMTNSIESSQTNINLTAQYGYQPEKRLRDDVRMLQLLQG
jgi:tape measure domain-containing protein